MVDDDEDFAHLHHDEMVWDGKDEPEEDREQREVVSTAQLMGMLREASRTGVSGSSILLLRLGLTVLVGT